MGRKDVGELTFINPVQLANINLDNVVDIEKGRIQMYGLPNGPAKPLPGSGLNGPAMLTFRRMHVKQKDEASVAKFVAKLRDHAAKIGGIFVHFDVDAGTWLMKVDCF